MQYSSLKPITLGLAIITLFAMSHKAHADTTTPYTCPEGGSVYATVNIVPKSPFSAGTPTSFIASGQITSTCSTRLMNLTAQNNSLPLITLISDTSISAGQTYPSIPNTTTFTSQTTAGSYAVHFVTGVEKLINSNYFVGGGPTAQPVQPISGDTNVVCGAGISLPSTNPGGDQVSYNYSYEISSTLGTSSTVYNGSCTVTILQGQMNGDNYPGDQKTSNNRDSVVISSYCFDASNSTVPNDTSSGVPSC